MEFSSAIGSAAAAAAILILYYYLLRRRSLNPKYKLPPEAGGARLILGHLHLMGDAARPPHFYLADMADQHGPIFTIRLGVRRAVVVSSWSIAKELFTSCDAAVSSRPKMRAIKHLSYGFAMFGFSPYGDYWREIRKIANTELLSSHRVEVMSHVYEPAIAQSVKEIYSRWEDERNIYKDGLSGRVLVDMKKWFAELNLNVILAMVAGKRFSAAAGEDDGEEMRRCRAVFRDFFHLLGLFVPADALPWLRWFDLGGLEKRMKRTAKELDGIMAEWVVEHRRKGGDTAARDFMDVMVSAVRGSEQLTRQADADTVIKSTCQMIIAGGADTSSVVLTWALSLLLNNRRVLAKAQEELDKHVGRTRRVKESDIPNLVYLQAVVKEILRLYPAGPLGGPREFTQDCSIKGYHIPKGTWLMVNTWKLQRDPDVWSDDALEFKPERFLTTRHGNIDVKGQNFELIPFGAGRRICPGTNLALHMMHLVLANLLQAFEVGTVCDEAVDMSESLGLSNLKATPLDVLVAPRLSPEHY
ncbi:cytochrome P450 CYP82D47-like [Andrographis paniculata]|uniref:cytochrome P450 CYP82D47-like n=1 Tax=Andrographis paniculata TaxID=175694 RepID=UPI0021E73759|nr:cytochrome P450 CYP82D47-like [Andrographis paniculata]